MPTHQQKQVFLWQVSISQADVDTCNAAKECCFAKQVCMSVLLFAVVLSMLPESRIPVQ